MHQVGVVSTDEPGWMRSELDVSHPPRPLTGYLVGVDIGGTFTDCAVVLPDGRVFTGKAPSTPPDLSGGFFDALADAADSMSLGLADLLANTDRLAHGTTTGLNALLTKSGARVALVTTAGHADAIRIMNDQGRVLGSSMAEMLDWSISSVPDPILPRELVVEVHERINSQGEVVAPLRDDEVSRVAAAVADCDVEAVAVSCLWSFSNRDHERRIRDALLSALPGMHVSCSSEVAPRIGIYPRTVATVMNAQLVPLMTHYVARIAERARGLGFDKEVFFVRDDGGLVPAGEAARFPVSTLRSGPVAGVVGTAVVGEQFEQPRIIVADMGGTTFDVSVIRDGQPGRYDESVLQRQLVHLRAVDVESVGAGGGSIAWVDDRTGVLRVGPRSAGARPGPICYGQGGTEVTVTDADLVLGILNPDRALAGNLKLDRDAAFEGLARLGERLGLDAVQCAAGVVEVVDSLMEDLVRRVTVQRGQDPRDFNLWVYGGASGAHAGLFSRQLGVERIVLPLGGTASVWSALGCTLLGLRREFATSVYVQPPWDLALVKNVLERLTEDAHAFADAIGIERVELPAYARGQPALWTPGPRSGGPDGRWCRLGRLGRGAPRNLRASVRRSLWRRDWLFRRRRDAHWAARHPRVERRLRLAGAVDRSVVDGRGVGRDPPGLLGRARNLDRHADPLGRLARRQRACRWTSDRRVSAHDSGGTSRSTAGRRPTGQRGARNMRRNLW